MDETTYKAWLELHRRMAHQEVLTPEERETYEAGLRQLYAEETYYGNYEEEIRAAKTRIAEMEQERLRLRAEYQAFMEELRSLETARAKRKESARGEKVGATEA